MAPIIAGIDFSAPSAAVLRHAAHAAGRSQAPIIAVHVLDTGIVSHWSSSAGMPGLDALTAQAKQKLDDLVATHVPHASIRTEVRIGRPASDLAKVVEEHHAGLLVIAANDLTKKRLGAIAAGCVRSVHSDVLVLRDWQEGNFRKIVVCTDFAPMSERALARGVELAVANGAFLEIVHVLYPPAQDLWGETILLDADATGTYEEEARKRADDQMARALSPHASTLSGVEHRCVVLESTSPAQALTWHIQETGADLAVLGTRSHSKVGGILLGTNAERLLHDAPVSVLAIRPSSDLASAEG